MRVVIGRRRRCSRDQMIVESQRSLLGCDGVQTGPIGSDVAALLPAIAECMRTAQPQRGQGLHTCTPCLS